MIFRQLFESESCTYTYLLGCPEARKALLLDPVAETADRDLAVLDELGLSWPTLSRRTFTPITSLRRSV